MTGLLLLDLETTGLEPEDRIVEAAAVLMDAELGTPLRAFSAVVAGDDNAAETINKIPVAALRSPAATTRARAVEALTRLADLIPGTHIVAHNASFDRGFLPELHDRTWICTLEDAVWSRCENLPPAGGGSLVALALAHDVGVTRAHRALEDCLTLAAVLRVVHREEGGLGGWLARAMEPKAEVIADVSFARNKLAKDAGFRWDPERKVWRKKVRESVLESERRGWGFSVEVRT